MKLSTLLCGVNYKSAADHGELNIPDVSIDTRKIVHGGLFVCQRGEKTDSHTLAAEAAAKGARVIVCERTVDVGASDAALICVDDTHVAAAQIFDNFYGNPAAAMRTVAVTGTNGKTSTAHMTRAIFEQAGYSTGLMGTVGNYIGASYEPSPMTTLTVDALYAKLAQMRDAGVTHLFMEASSHSLSYDKLYPIVFDAGIFTNLTPEHLDFHKTMDAYAQAKAKLFAQSVISVINFDDPRAEYMYNRALGRAYYFSTKNSAADFWAHDARTSVDGNEYFMVTKKGSLHIKTSVPGAFSISNSLAAAATASLLGISGEEIAQSFARMTGVPGRMERVPIKADFSVFVDYAHTPDALETVLNNLRDIRKDGERLTVLFGCGGDRDRTKRPIMGGIAERLADRVIVTSDNSRSETPSDIISEILSGMKSSPEVIENRKCAIEYAVSTALPNEIILVAGKGHEDYEITKEGKRPFSEKAIIAEAAKRRE